MLLMDSTFTFSSGYLLNKFTHTHTQNMSLNQCLWNIEPSAYTVDTNMNFEFAECVVHDSLGFTFFTGHQGP
jgi:hypothetical protein